MSLLAPKTIKQPPKSPPRWGFVYSALITAAVIGLGEAVYPNSLGTNPGLLFWLTTIAIAYWLGALPTVVSVAMISGYIALGSWIPGSMYATLSRNDVRAWGSAIVFGSTGLITALVRARIRREAIRAYEAGKTAEEEALIRRRTEVDLRDSEEMRRLIVESSMDAIIVTDDEGRIVLWNRHAEDCFHWKADEVIGKSLQDLLAFSHERSAGERFEAKSITRDGSALDIEGYSVPHEGQSGRVWITFARDISERKAGEAAIHNLNTSLEQRVEERTSELLVKNEELEGFSYAVSHDLRAPLRSIVANARIVLEEEGDRVSDAGKKNLERLSGAAMRMSMLVDDLLQYARLGNRALRSEQVDISELAKTVVDDLRPDYPDAVIEIEDGMMAEADPMLVSLILNNLIDNGCKYTPANERAHVTVSRDSDGIYSVRDEGIGIEMEYAPHLFKPFQRLHSQSEYPGTGIGLANVRRAVERHGGSVWLDSQKGEGTSVFFTLGPVDAALEKKHLPKAKAANM